MTRRTLLASTASAAAAALAGPNAAAAGAADPPGRRAALGFVVHSFPVRGAAEPGFAAPGRFLEHCRGLGAETVQVDIGTPSDAEADALRGRAAEAGVTLEGIVPPPRDAAADLRRFEAAVAAAKRAGAGVVRTVLTRGRRYETFDSDAAFRASADAALNSLNLAAPVLAKHGVRLAVENHKDFRADELVGLLRRAGGDHVGVCVDTGNSLALLEDPWETVEALAPYAFSCHLKDVAVAESADGFLLAEVPFGAGVVDLRRVVAALTAANPAIGFQIEMITRDPLKVPCLTDRYWATFPALPGRHLARTLALARAHPPAHPLPLISTRPPADRLKAEDDNVRRCFAYARDRLGL